MQPYKCKLRLNGNLNNEVVKRGVTAPEIMVLRALHGADAVVDISEDGPMDKRSHSEERARIMLLYANQEAMTDVTFKARMEMMRNLFGPDSGTIPLPARLPDTQVAEPAEPAGPLE